MNIKIIILLLSSVSLSAFAQIAFKFGMSANNIQETINQKHNWFALLYQAFTQPYVLIGLACYGLGASIWLLVLARIDVSVAYPFVGLGFILTMFLGALLLGEQMGAMRVIGTILVVIGVIIVAHT